MNELCYRVEKDWAGRYLLCREDMTQPVFCGFDLKTATELAALLNENDVAACHAQDVVHDQLYSRFVVV